MTEISLITKIAVSIGVVAMWSTCAYLGWRVLRLKESVELLRIDRNELLGSRMAWESKLITKMTGKIDLSELDKKMILNALKMPEYKKAMEDPKTKHHVRKAYKMLKEKIRESLKQ